MKRIFAGIAYAACCLGLIALALPASNAARADSVAESVASSAEVMLGTLTREAIERQHPEWGAAAASAKVDAAAAQGLASVPPGAEVDIFLGTWCSDSRREVPRLWKALDDVGGVVPFTLRYVGVDRTKSQPEGLLRGWDIKRLPTFVVRRNGREVGRVVERAPHGIENDLRALLSGAAHGVIGSGGAAAAERRH